MAKRIYGQNKFLAWVLKHADGVPLTYQDMANQLPVGYESVKKYTYRLEKKRYLSRKNTISVSNGRSVYGVRLRVTANGKRFLEDLQSRS